MITPNQTKTKTKTKTIYRHFFLTWFDPSSTFPLPLLQIDCSELSCISIFERACSLGNLSTLSSLSQFNIFPFYETNHPKSRSLNSCIQATFSTIIITRTTPYKFYPNKCLDLVIGRKSKRHFHPYLNSSIGIINVKRKYPSIPTGKSCNPNPFNRSQTMSVPSQWRECS